MTVEPEVTARVPREPAKESTHPLEEELAQARAEMARQHALFKKAVDECERLNANATHVQVELKSFQVDRQQLKAEVAQARQAVAVAEARAAELADTLSATQQEAEALRYQAGVEINALHERLSTVEAERAARESELHEAKAEHTEILRSLAKTRAELSKLTTEATGLRSEVEVLRQDFEATTQQLAVTGQQLGEAQARLESLSEEHGQASAERDDWRQKAEGYRQDLAALDNGRSLLEIREQYEELQRKHQSLEITLAERTEEAKRDNDVLRGIVARQNTTLGVYHTEVRRLRRARYGLRLIYGLFSLGLLALAFLAFYIFAPQQLMKIFGY